MSKFMPVEHLGINPEKVLMSFQFDPLKKTSQNIMQSKSRLFNKVIIPEKPNLTDDGALEVLDQIDKMTLL